MVAADAAAEILAETDVLIAGKKYCKILYVKYCMHALQNRDRSVTCILCDERVVQERTHAS